MTNQNEITLEDIAYFDALNDNKDVTLYRDNPDYRRFYDDVRLNIEKEIREYEAMEEEEEKRSSLERIKQEFRNEMTRYLRGSVSKTESLELKNDYFRTRLTIRQRLDIWEEIHGDNND